MLQKNNNKKKYILFIGKIIENSKINKSKFQKKKNFHFKTTMIFHEKIIFVLT